VFLSEQGALVPASQVRFFHDDVLSLPDDIRQDLEGALLPLEGEGDDDGGSGEARGGKRQHHQSHQQRHNQLKKRPAPAPAVCAFNRELERRIRGGVSAAASERRPEDLRVLLAAQRGLAAAASATSGGASSCAVRVTEAVPRAFAQLAAAARSPLSEADAAAAVRLTTWALKTNQPHLVTHALVNDLQRPDRVTLVPVAEAFMGRAFDDDAGADLEDAASLELPFISAMYLGGSERVANAMRHRWSDFWRTSGAQGSVSFEATSREIRGKPGAAPIDARAKIVTFLPNGVLPGQRKTAVSGAVVLPYGLGCLQSAKQYWAVDAALAPVWRAVLSGLQRDRQLADGGGGGVASRATRAAAFARALSRCRFDHSVVALEKTVSAAKDAFQPLATAGQPLSSSGILLSWERFFP